MYLLYKYSVGVRTTQRTALPIMYLTVAQLPQLNKRLEKGLGWKLCPQYEALLTIPFYLNL